MDNDTRKTFIYAVEGENKERDYLILEYHALYPDHSVKEMLENTGIGLSEQRIGQILKTNSLLILQIFARINPLYFKEGRALELAKMYRRKVKGGVFSGKDPADIAESLRKEIEGDKGTSVGVVIYNKEKDGEVKLNPNDIAFQNRIRSDIKASRLPQL